MEANTDVIRSMLDAVRRQDRDAFIACLTPDVEWDDREGWPGVRRMYHGAAGVRQWWDAFTTVGGKVVSAEIEELAETSDQRVLLGVYGTFRSQSGGRENEFAARAWYVFWLRNGKVARGRLYWDRGEACEAAGLSG
jgi:ketosteroid isomerase-like protein